MAVGFGGIAFRLDQHPQLQKAARAAWLENIGSHKSKRHQCWPNGNFDTLESPIGHGSVARVPFPQSDPENLPFFRGKSPSNPQLLARSMFVGSNICALRKTNSCSPTIWCSNLAMKRSSIIAYGWVHHITTDTLGWFKIAENHHCFQS